jgi:hypothetical protein
MDDVVAHLEIVRLVIKPRNRRQVETVDNSGDEVTKQKQSTQKLEALGG